MAIEHSVVEQARIRLDSGDVREPPEIVLAEVRRRDFRTLLRSDYASSQARLWSPLGRRQGRRPPLYDCPRQVWAGQGLSYDCS